MNTIKKTFFLACNALFLIVASCSKKSDSNSSSISVDALAGTYVTTGLKIGTNAETDVYPTASFCDKNDKWEFDTTGQFFYQGQRDPSGNSTCPDFMGTWSLKATDSLMMDVGAAGGQVNGLIQSFNRTSFVLRYNSAYNGQAVIVTRTFTRQ